jgi:prepilin-type N-terminal cleavage/methylation domain-containing protein
MRRALSLVELLVVIAIVAILLALLLPAVQAAREAARRSQCQNNLKQIGAALLTYHDVRKSFPHGGWGHVWVGTAERGVGKGQPGGWIYSLLPFVEEQDLQQLGVGQLGADAVDSLSRRLRTPICLFNCSTRRPCRIWPISDKYPHVRTPKPYGAVAEVARSDYAINGGSSALISHGGPSDFNQGDDALYWHTAVSDRRVSGVSHVRFAVSLKRVLDGSSKTYLVGEKYIEFFAYDSGESLGDSKSLYAGYCTDLNRFAGAIELLSVSQSPLAAPLDDNSIVSSGVSGSARFGSAHSQGFNMLNCDGSTNFTDFAIDPEIHLRLGHRNDAGAALESLVRFN